MRASVLLCLMLGACDGSVGGVGVDKPDDTATDEGAATLTASPSEIDFGDISFQELHTETVNLTNLGEANLVISSITTEAPFSVSPSNITVMAGSTATLTVYVQTQGYEDYASAITLVTDDPDVGTVAVPLHAATITDEDGDGFALVAAGGDDCDDTESSINPDAEEEWYDGVDQNCDALNDYDRDGDGYEAETDFHHPQDPDCIDSNANVNPGVYDTPYDGVDSDCSGNNDFDQDADGYLSLEYGLGSDCDDTDPSINIEGIETFNGADDDCDGETDMDAEPQYASYVYERDGSSDRAGYSMALGDLDGDGIAELVVGQPYSAGSGGTNRGAISVFLGGDLLPSGTALDDADNWFRADNNNELMGSTVSVFGDFDGDGIDDLAIGAPGASSNSGKVYVMAGEDALRRDTSDAMATYTGTSSSYFGRGLATDIDLDGDGIDELVVAYASGSNNYVAIEYGGAPASASLDSFDARFATDGTEAAFYRNAPVGGDLDGDGATDLILSDGTADYGSTSNSGAVWALWGQSGRYSASGSDIESTATTIAYGTSSSAYVGWSTQLGEDWDSDGDAELWMFDAGANALYVIEGGTNRRSPFTASSAATVSYAWSSSRPDAEMIRRAGDWSGDGVDDMMVFLEDASSYYGLSFLFSSEIQSGTGLDDDDNIIAEIQGTTDYGNGNAGYGMVPMGMDVDGDGDDDFAIGDPEHDSNAGEAYLFLNALN